MRRIQHIAILAAVAGASTACGMAPGERAPMAAFREQWDEQVPKHTEVRSFNVEARENTGNSVEPVWSVRFRSELRLSDDILEEDRVERGVVFFRKVADKGTTAIVHGVGTARLQAGEWKIDWAVDNLREIPRGVRRAVVDSVAAADSIRVMVVGSPAEREYNTELARYLTAEFAGSSTQHDLWGRAVLHDLVLRIVRFNPDDGTAEGFAEWPGLGGAVKALAGTYKNGTLTLKETEWVEERANVLLGIEYRLAVPETGEAVAGSWRHPRGSGTVKLTRL